MTPLAAREKINKKPQKSFEATEKLKFQLVNKKGV
jgi:hypothetical protein